MFVWSFIHLIITYIYKLNFRQDNKDHNDFISDLDFNFRYQQFERDCDETKSWINEKLKVASDDSYLDPTNLNGKVQKHQNFEQVWFPFCAFWKYTRTTM